MKKGIKIKLISSQNQIEAGCVKYDSIINVIENVFKQYQMGKVMLPDKISQVFNQETQDRINCMPSALLDQRVCGVKWVSVFPGNPHKYGLQNVSGIIILSEMEKGFPFAVMDGTLITALRTAAMGAIGAKYLARDDSQTYGTIGAGEQARMHLKFIKHVFPKLDTCYVASRTYESEKKFITDMNILYPDMRFIPCKSDYRKASKKADIVVTAVSCQEPLLKADSIKKGTYYCHVGGWEDEYEVPLKADKIVCDNWNALKHRGSPTLARLFVQGRLKDEDIYGNIAELICGTKPGREKYDEFTYFNSIGLSFVDVAVAYSFYKMAIEHGCCQEWEM